MTVVVTVGDKRTGPSTRMRISRVLPMALSSALLLSAMALSPALAQQEGEPLPEASQAATEETQELDFGSGSAIVMLGDVRYEFSTDVEAGGSVMQLGLCQEIFGIVAASLTAADGSDITLDMEIPPPDWETYVDGRYGPPRIEVRINDPYQSWIADAAWATLNDIDGQSQVDSFEQDGIGATGTATFIEQRSIFDDPPGEPVQGTFEVRCAEE